MLSYCVAVDVKCLLESRWETHSFALHQMGKHVLGKAEGIFKYVEASTAWVRSTEDKILTFSIFKPQILSGSDLKLWYLWHTKKTNLQGLSNAKCGLKTNRQHHVGACWKRRTSGPGPDLWNQNPCFNKIPRWCIWEALCMRSRVLMWKHN